MINRTTCRPVLVADIRVPMLYAHVARTISIWPLARLGMRLRRTAIADRKEGGMPHLWGAPISARVTRKSAPFRGIQLHGVQPKSRSRSLGTPRSFRT